MSNELGNTPADKDYKPSGISRAEEKANKRWPIHPWTILPKEGEHGAIINFDEWLEDFRLGVQSFSLNAGYKEGYEQAEKDMKERFIHFVHRHYPINYIGWIQDFQRAMEDEK